MTVEYITGTERHDVSEILLTNIHPGNILKLDYLPRMHITEYRLARILGITQTHLAEFLAGKRNVTANLSLRLGKVLGQPPDYWLNLQNRHDLLKAWRDFGDAVERLSPFEWPT